MITLHDDDVDPASIPPLDVRRAEHDGAVVLEVFGAVDLSNAAQLQAAFDQVLRDEPTVLVVDLSEVTFLGSIALSVLIETHGKAGPGGMRMAALSPVVRRVIEISALDQLFSIYPTVDVALQANPVER